VAKPADLAKYFDVELRRKRASVDVREKNNYFYTN